MAKFSDLLKEVKAEEEAAKIKLEVGVPYLATIVTCGESTTQNGKVVIQVNMLLEDEAVKGKKIKRNYYVDESYSDQVRKIAYAGLVQLLQIGGVTVKEDIEEDEFVALLLKLKKKQVYVVMTRTADKKDPSIVYTNYSIYKNKEDYKPK